MLQMSHFAPVHRIFGGDFAAMKDQGTGFTVFCPRENEARCLLRKLLHYLNGSPMN